MKEILLITPPFTQLNTPYPATAYLKGFLNTKSISCFQMDLGIEVTQTIFSKQRIATIFKTAEERKDKFSANSKRIFALRKDYITTIDSVINFLQGNNQTFARTLCSAGFLPRASRFEQLDDMEWAFGSMGIMDKAKHFATLYLEDISDFIIENIDSHFGFSRYAERLGRSANSFDEMASNLANDLTYIDTITIAILEEKIKTHLPKLVLISVPFPGNLYSAFRCAQWIKNNFPKIKISMGGGFPNTELRELKDRRVFDYFDFITLDDGELPVELLYNHVLYPSNDVQLKRTFLLENDEVVYNNNSNRSDYKQSHVGTPDYSDLILDNYISVIEIANPMHSLWSDGRWNKLTMAHGCYWGKCTFCDITLDYIKIYEPVAAKTIVDRMEELISSTGTNGFHFVDEAAPPSLMKEVAIEILKRELIVTWWTNIRFEKSFTNDLCFLLKKSDCVAVSGGLEVASDRLLELIKKGVTVTQVANVTRNFSENGILVHSYLMYGYPTQTIQETVDSLEMVRQLFEMGCIQSGFWHQFAMTAHAPVGINPEEFGVEPRHVESDFAKNDIEFADKTGINHEKFSYGLKKSLFNFMHGIGIEYDLQEWFEFKIPKTTIKPTFIEKSISENDTNFSLKFKSRLIWIGTNPVVTNYTKNKKGRNFSITEMNFHNNDGNITINIEEEKATFIMAFLERTKVTSNEKILLSNLKTAYETKWEDFEIFWFSKPIKSIQQLGFLVI